MCLVVASVLLQGTRSPPGLRLPKMIGDTHPLNHNIIGKERDINYLIQFIRTNVVYKQMTDVKL